MRALALIGTVSLTLGLAAAAGSAAPARTPTLRVDSHGIYGRNFNGRERVRLTFVFQIREVRQVRTTATGAFVTPLPAAYDPCTEALSIAAVGARGDVARLKLPQRACPPA
jgi:hypothetical protein